MAGGTCGQRGLRGRTCTPSCPPPCTRLAGPFLARAPHPTRGCYGGHRDRWLRFGRRRRRGGGGVASPPRGGEECRWDPVGVCPDVTRAWLGCSLHALPSLLCDLGHCGPRSAPSGCSVAGGPAQHLVSRGAWRPAGCVVFGIQQTSPARSHRAQAAGGRRQACHYSAPYLVYARSSELAGLLAAVGSRLPGRQPTPGGWGTAWGHRHSGDPPRPLGGAARSTFGEAAAFHQQWPPPRAAWPPGTGQPRCDLVATRLTAVGEPGVEGRSSDLLGGRSAGSPGSWVLVVPLGQLGCTSPGTGPLQSWFGPSQLHPIPVSSKSLLTFRQEGHVKYRGQLGGGGVGLHCLPVYF